VKVDHEIVNRLANGEWPTGMTATSSKSCATPRENNRKEIAWLWTVETHKGFIPISPMRKGFRQDIRGLLPRPVEVRPQEAWRCGHLMEKMVCHGHANAVTAIWLMPVAARCGDGEARREGPGEKSGKGAGEEGRACQEVSREKEIEPTAPAS
jgi:hypothetical protein